MDVAAFDRWRAAYDRMSYADQVAFYNQVEVDHPHQVHFDASAFLAFLHEIAPGFRLMCVLEVGGWKGELAQAVLPQMVCIDEWVNYEVSERARDLSVCSDGRYFVIVPGDFAWNITLPDADVFVCSHTIEHIKARHLAALLDNLPDSIYYVGLQAPLPESETAVDWSGYWGSHILEIGWAQVIEMMRERGFRLLEHLTRGEFRAFERE